MYMEEQKLNLRWNDFQENAISAFGSLREEIEFADVTLVCEDYSQVEAHKVILASSSPFFKNLLRKNKHPHPLIYMKGLKSHDLVAVIDFLYYGEASVYQENLDSFLAVAEDLQLKGLMESGAEKKVEEANKEQLAKTNTTKPVQVHKTSKQEETTPKLSGSEYVYKVEACPPVQGVAAVTDYTVTADLENLEEQIKSMMEVSEHKDKYNNGRSVICKICGKEGHRSDMKKHIEAKHITGVSHTCNICGKTSRSRNGLNKHVLLHHKSI